MAETDPMLSSQKTITPDIGLEEADLNGVNVLLSKALGSVYTLGAKTKKYHWNITGQEFQQLHELFDEQYSILQTIVDDIAEYIRSYGAMSPGTLEEFQQLSVIEEKAGYNPPAFEMVADLVADYEQLMRMFREHSQLAVNEYNDVQAEDLYIGFMHTLSKQAWFLRSHLENQGKNV